MSQSFPLLHIKSSQTVLNLTQRSIDEVFLYVLCGLFFLQFYHFLPINPNTTHPRLGARATPLESM